MPTKFNMTRDISGFNGFGLVPTEDGYSGLLSAGGPADSITVPSEYPNYIAIFSPTPGSNIFVDFTTTATIPAGGMASDTSRLNPQARQVEKGSTISMINADATDAYMTVEFYVISNYTN